MPEYLAPGVFVEETSFRQKTIEGVGTSTAAFVGPTRFGPVDGLPELLTSFGDFERIFAGIDPLRFGGDQAPNLLAAGVRAFFENGGRRCYVARATHTAQSPVEATGRIPAATATGGHLRLAARHPGRAGNFQVTLTLRMGPNLLDTSNPSLPRLRGAEEHQVVWLDDLAGEPSTLAYLRDHFDEAAGTWTYTLMAAGADPDTGLGLVSRLDTAVTTDVRMLTVDVQVGPLGRFMDAQPRAGMSLHPEHRGSVQQVFRPDGDRSTELVVPLVVTMEGVDDGPGLARALLAASGAAAGLSGTGVSLRLGGAVGGAVDLTFDDGTTEREVSIAFDATAATVTGALLAAGLAGAVVTTPRDGVFVIAVDGQHDVGITGNSLSVPGTVTRRRGNRLEIDTANPTGRFALLADGLITPQFNSNVAPDRVDDALEAIVGAGNASARRDAGGNLVVTLWGSHSRRLEVVDNATPVGVPFPVVELEVLASGGTFQIGLGGGALASVAAPADEADATMTATATAITNALGAGGPGDPVATVEGGAFVVRLTPDQAAAGIVLPGGPGLTAAPGTATPSVTAVDDSLLTPGSSAVLTARLADGTDGAFPDEFGYRGDADGVRKSGLGSFTDLHDVAIVAAPGSTWDFANRQSEAVGTIGALIDHCEDMRYRIAVIDSAPGMLPSDVARLRGQFDSSHAAIYYPWVTTYDVVTGRSQQFPPSGYVAGIYARNDVERGVHKAPANETVSLAVGFESSVNTAQQEMLNPLGVNCLRLLEGRGRRVWGARTMTSDPEWKYVNVRRYFAFLEASIDRGTQWAVFEPNGPLLWDNVRRTIEDFLINEYAGGRLLGDEARGGVLRALRPLDHDAERPGQRSAHLSHRRRAPAARRVRHLPHRPEDARRDDLTPVHPSPPEERTPAMATPRERPYGQFNFLVDISDINDATTANGGFQEVSGLGVEITVAEYRNGNDKFNYPQKIMGLSKASDVTLKRGVIGDLSLHDWIKAVQEGDSPVEQLKNVTITLLAEDRATAAQTWELANARPMKYTGPTFSGTGGESAVEELVLSCERITQK